jgi:hypothetical protein
MLQRQSIIGNRKRGLARATAELANFAMAPRHGELYRNTAAYKVGPQLAEA